MNKPIDFKLRYVHSSMCYGEFYDIKLSFFSNKQNLMSHLYVKLSCLCKRKRLRNSLHLKSETVTRVTNPKLQN